MEAAIRKAEALGAYPLFTKPANLGSSVGITKCNSRADLGEGLMEAAAFDRRILVERGVVNAREIEVSVLGNDEPDRLRCRAKCCRAASSTRTNPNTWTAPAGWSSPRRSRRRHAEQIRELAVRAYQAIDCAGMARVDFFLEKETGRVLLNELNTLPGFTSISMYPKLVECDRDLLSRIGGPPDRTGAGTQSGTRRHNARISEERVSDKKSLPALRLVRQRRKNERIARLARTPTAPSRPTPTMPRRDVHTRRRRPCAPNRRPNPSASTRRVAAAPGAVNCTSRALSAPHPHRLETAVIFPGCVIRRGIYFAWTLPISASLQPTLVGNQMLSAEEIECRARPEQCAHLPRRPRGGGEPLAAELPGDHFSESHSGLAKQGDSDHHRTPACHPLGAGRRVRLGGRPKAWPSVRVAKCGLVAVSASGIAAMRPEVRERPATSHPVRCATPIIESIRVLAPHVPQGSRLLYNPRYGLGWVDGRGWTVWFGIEAQRSGRETARVLRAGGFAEPSAASHPPSSTWRIQAPRTIAWDNDMDEIVVGIDVGTTKICTLVGRVEDDKSIRILGVGIEPSEGIKKGNIVDLNAATQAITRSVERAEHTSGLEITRALVSLAGAHVSSVNSRGTSGDHGRGGG